MFLQAHPDPVLLSTLIPYIISAAGLLLAGYALFRKESREDGQTTAQRLKTMEMLIAKHEKRQEGFQLEIENVADHGKREREMIVENSKRDHAELQHQIKDMPSMRDLLNRMDERFINTNEAVRKLESKMDKILDLLTHK